jgi:hypothetical protein
MAPFSPKPVMSHFSIIELSLKQKAQRFLQIICEGIGTSWSLQHLVYLCYLFIHDKREFDGVLMYRSVQMSKHTLEFFLQSYHRPNVLLTCMQSLNNTCCLEVDFDSQISL